MATTPRYRLLSLLLVAALSTACATSPVAGWKRRASTDVGKQLVLSVTDLDGRVVDVGADQGRVRVVDFWATWCEPCRDALPALDQMARDLGGRGLSVYAVSIDSERAPILQFLARSPVGLPVLWDPAGAELARFDAAYMPVTLVVDRAGVIRHVYEGWTLARQWEERDDVERLLAEP